MLGFGGGSVSWAAGISGLMTLGIGVWFALRDRSEDSPVFYALLLAAAGSTWLLATLLFSTVKEQPGETDGGANGFQRVTTGLHVQKSFFVPKICNHCEKSVCNQVCPYDAILRVERERTPA